MAHAVVPEPLTIKNRIPVRKSAQKTVITGRSLKENQMVDLEDDQREPQKEEQQEAQKEMHAHQIDVNPMALNNTLNKTVYLRCVGVALKEL